MSQSGSFIPQQQTAPARAPRRRRIYIIGYAIYAVFFGVLITVGFLFVWGWQLDSELAAQQQKLTDERASFKQSDMILVQEIDDKLALIEFVLNKQPAVTRVFDALEETTVSTIQITDFDVASEETMGNAITVTYVGVTDSFDAVMTQRSAMAQNPILSNAKIVDVAFGTETESEVSTSGGVISYSVTLEIPLADVQYQGRQAPSSDQTINTVTTQDFVEEGTETADSTFTEETNDPVL